MQCQAAAHTVRGKEAHNKRSCGGAHPHLANMMNKGHALMSIDAIPVLLFCARCGAFAGRRPRLLLEPCRRTISIGCQHAVDRIRQGLHPKRDEAIPRPVPINSSTS